MLFNRNPKEREVLSEKSVAVIGCGSVGSAIAEMLVRAGLGKIELIDPDTLSEENLARHLLTRKDLGHSKVEAMRERLLEINPDCLIQARAESFRDVEADMIVSCVDSYKCESRVNAVSLEKSIPAVYIGCWGAARVGEILYGVPGKTSCYECFSSFRKKADIPVDQRKYTDPDFDDSRVPGQGGLWANILVVSGFAFQVILGLCGIRQTIDYEHVLWLVNVSDYESNLKSMAVTFGTVRKGCAVCDESKLAELTL